MDRKISDLTVVEMYGLLALALAVFYLVGMMIRTYEPDWPARVRLTIWAGVIVLAGLPVYHGLTVLFPDLPGL